MNIDEQIQKAKSALKELQKKKRALTSKEHSKIASLLKEQLADKEFSADFIKLLEKHKVEKLLKIIKR